MPRNPDRRPSRLLAAGALFGTGLLALAGCASPAASDDDAPRIVATTTQVADFTRQLVGGQGEVTQLVQPDQSAHAFDPSAAQLLALREADALVVNGAGLESWLDDAIDASGFDGVLIDASTGIELEATDEHDDHDHDDHADEHDDHDHDDHADESVDDGQGGDADDTTTIVPDKTPPATPEDEADEHDHDHDEDADEHGHEGHDHDHEGGNPHIWTSPANAELMVENIAAGLAEVPGVDTAELESNEQAYLAQLDALDEWIRASVDQVPVADRLLVTNHDAFTYFVDAYDITFVGSVIPSFDDNAEPSAAEIDALVERIRDTGVKAVFSEASISPKAAETIAREAGVTVYSGADSLYGDSLGVAGSEGESYLGSQIHNVRLIVESWGVEPAPLPAALQE